MINKTVPGMVKRLILLFALLLPPAAYAEPHVTDCVAKRVNIIPEFKASYFRPASAQVRNVYAKAIVRYDFDLNFRLAPGVWAWSGVGFWEKHGFSERTGLSTRIADIPATLGVKFTMNIGGKFRPYIGAGARYDYLRIKTDVNGKEERKDKGAVGVALVGGLHIDLPAGIYLFPFYEYARNKITHNKIESGVLNRSVEAGGYNAGLGIGAWL